MFSPSQTKKLSANDWNFTPSPSQPFVAKLRIKDSDEWHLDTVVNFINTDNLSRETWQIAAGYSRLYDPLAILSLLYSHWPMFSGNLAGELGFIDSPEKSANLRNLLTKDTPYHYDGSPNKVSKNAYPMKIHGLHLDRHKKTVSFYVGIYSGGFKNQRPYIFDTRVIAQSFLDHQYAVRVNHQIERQSDHAPPYMNIRHWLNDSKEPMVNKIDALTLRTVFSKKSSKLPLVYVQLWSGIVNDLHTPDVLRIRVLLQFYDKILKSFFTAADQEEFEEMALKEAREALRVNGHFDYAVIPDEACSKMVKTVLPKSYTDHASEQSKTGISTLSLMANAASNVIDKLHHQKNTRNHLEDLYQLLIKDQQSALETYLILKSLFYMVHAHIDTDPVEQSYLDNYVQSIENALSDFESMIEQNRRHLNDESKQLLGLRACETTPAACKDMLKLKQSPYAWDKVLNQYKYHVALKNFSLGYEITRERGFLVTQVTFSEIAKSYEVHYQLPNAKSASFFIKNSPELDKFLRDETKLSFNLPLSRRIVQGDGHDQNALNDIQNKIKILFSDKHQSLWPTIPRIVALKQQLLNRINANEYLLTMHEKIDLIIYSLVACILEDEDLIGPVAEIFKLMTDESQDCALVSKQDFVLILTRCNQQGVSVHEVYRRKAKLCVTMHEIGALETDKSRFATQEQLDKVMGEKEPDDRYFSISLDKQLRLNQKKLINDHLKTELQAYEHEDLAALYTLYFCLNQSTDPRDGTLELLEKIAVDVIRGAPKNSHNVWVSGVMFHALTKFHLYRKLDGLALITLADKLLIETGAMPSDGNKKSLLSLLDQFEMVSLEKDIIPEFKGELIFAPAVQLTAPPERSKTKYKTLVVIPPAKTDQGTQTDHSGPILLKPQPSFIERGWAALNSLPPSAQTPPQPLIQMIPQGESDTMKQSTSLSPPSKQPIATNLAATNAGAYESFKKAFAAPKILDECLAKLKEYDLLKKRMLSALQNKNISTTDLVKQLTPFDNLARDALDLHDTTKGLLDARFSSLDRYYQMVEEEGHVMRFFDRDEVKQIRQRVQEISIVSLEEMVAALSSANTQFNNNLQILQPQLDMAEKQRVINFDNSESRKLNHLVQSAPAIIRQLTEYESRIRSECLRFEPKTAAKIFAYKSCKTIEGIESLKTGSQALQYAELLLASSQLRLSLAQIHGSSPQMPTIDQQYKSLHDDFVRKETRYHDLSYWTSPFKKYRLKQEIDQLKNKMHPYETIVPATGVKGEYAKLSYWNPFESFAKLKLFKQLKDPVMANAAEDEKIYVKTEEELQEQFEILLLKIPSNEKRQTPQMDNLLWMADKLQDKRAREYLGLHSDNENGKRISQCETEIKTMRKAMIFKGAMPPSLETFFNQYQQATVWVDPLEAVQSTCVSDLMKNVSQPETAAHGSSVTNLNGNSLTTHYGRTKPVRDYLNDEDNDDPSISSKARYS